MLMFSLYCRCNFIAEDGHVTETFLYNMKILTVLFVLKFLMKMQLMNETLRYDVLNNETI